MAQAVWARPATVVLPPPVEEPESRGWSMWWVGGSIVAILALLAYAYGHFFADLDTAAGFVVAPILLLLVVPLMRRERRLQPDFDAAGLLFAAFTTKLLMAFLRIYMVDVTYDGNGDSTMYDQWGHLVADKLRAFDFDLELDGSIPGTPFIRLSTGILYALFGADKFSGFLIYSFIGFLGCYLLYRAFVTAVPRGDHRRYALLIFFWPSVIFWPSAIGKEAWMLGCIGLAAWGTARILSRRRFGYVPLIVGVAGMYAVRPHIAILFVSAVGAALLVGLIFRSDDKVKSFGFLSKAGAVLLIAVMGAVLAPRVATFLEIDDVGGSGFTEALDEVEHQTSTGGSSFESVKVNGPADYPWAFVTVVFRPFPHEITNFQSATSAFEGIVLIGMLAFSFSRIRRLPLEFIKEPYAAFAIIYVLIFVYVFASIANFGILVRQRTQMLPFVFVMLALTKMTDSEAEPAANDVDQQPARLAPVTAKIAPPRAVTR